MEINKFSKEDDEKLVEIAKKYHLMQDDRISITKCKEFVKLTESNIESVKAYIKFYELSEFKPEEPVFYEGRTYLIKCKYRQKNSEGDWEWTSVDLISYKGEILKEVNISEIKPYSIASKILFEKGQ